jgi:hypothetical protein
MQRYTLPMLQSACAEPTINAKGRLHLSLALLPMDPGQVEYLYSRLLRAEPHEVAVLRNALAPYKETLTAKLWAVAAGPAAGPQRLRAAAALADYDAGSPRWRDIQTAVAGDLVGVPAVYLGAWMDGLRPVRSRLVEPLGVIYRDPKRRETERSLATDLLADYAADDPGRLADLVMDGYAKQFALLLAMLGPHEQRARTIFDGELKKRVVTRTASVLKVEDALTETEPPVKIVGAEVASLPAKAFPLKVRAGKRYILTMDSTALDAFLVLYDSAGKQLAFDDDSGGQQNALIVYAAAKDETCRVYAASFKGAGAFVLTVTETDGTDDAREALAKRQANAAVALVRLGVPDQAWPVLKHSRDPRSRSYLIHRLAPFGADPAAILRRIVEEPDVTVRRALILSLGEYDEKELPPADRQTLIGKLETLYRTADDPGLHAAAEWLLRHWNHHAWLKETNAECARDPELGRTDLAGREPEAE